VLRLPVDKAGKVVIDQFTNRRTRHQHAFINVKLMAAEPGFIGEVGNRDTFIDAANDALNDTVTLAGGQRALRISSGISSGR
jgi:hypothetical protein